MTYELNASAKGIVKALGDSIEISPGVHVPKMALVDYLGELIGVQSPISTDNDSVYYKDIKHSLSNSGTFAEYDVSELFRDLDSSIYDSSPTNPKWFEFFLERPMRSGSIALVSKDGTFSNTKVIYKDRQNSVLYTVDDTANSTKYTSHKYDIVTTTNVCCIRVEFHTADPVSLSFVYMRKVHTSRSYISGTRDDSNRGDAILDNENRIQVNSQPYLYGVAEQAISGHYSLLKFGSRTSVAANTQSVIWEGTNPLYTYLTSAEVLKVSSSSAADAAVGTGIRTLTIFGLDANWFEISETVTLDGTNVVDTVNSFIRVFRAYGETSGTGLTNAGNITITNNAGNNQLIYIPAGDGQTLMTMWTVPAGKVAYLVQGTVSSDTNKGARVSMFVRLNDGGVSYPWLIKYRAFIFSGNSIFPFNIPFRIPAKTDIEVRVRTPAAAGVTSIGATFELWYEDV